MAQQQLEVTMTIDAYEKFLRRKIKLASFDGFDVPLEQINPALKPHTRDIVKWAVKGGNRAIFASFGLHKTATQLELMRQIGVRHPDAYRLQVAPLGVRQEFTREVEQRFTGDCAMDLRFIRSDAEIDDPATVYMTNYESVREGKVTPAKFRATSLDEASVLRSYGSKTYQEFLPAFEVRIDIVNTESERETLATLKKKWDQHNEMQAKMAEIIRTYGLNHLAMQDTLARTIGCTRQHVQGERFDVANNDCVAEAVGRPENSVDLIVTSIPFANHYEYSPSYNDFGHTEDNAHLWEQMDFLTPQLLRILKPGRIYACHVKDRINFGNVTGAGIPTVSPFHAEALFHGIKHGFDYMGMVTVITDVVRENNQTYRLGYTEMCKDGSKMGVGSPEYILLFHKPQTDRSRGYADTPIRKDKAEYSLARWQVDAHAFWRSSGNRLMTADEMAAMGPAKLAKFFTEDSLRNVYDYDKHVSIGEQLQERNALPSTFMSLAPGSHHPDVWHDIHRMRTLNGEQANRAVEKHVCPLQFDIVDRLIERYSMAGEVVYDPFHGLGTVGVRAIKKGRRAAGSELNAAYFKDQVHYLQAAEREFSMPTLFDLDEPEEMKEAA